MFDLSQLRCFVAVAEELHFGRAAARLNMTQPPLSRQIQVLERILGAILLERTSRSVRLTPAGRSFLPEARRILRLADSAALTTKRIAAGMAGSLKIGFTATSAYGFLPELIKACRSRLPDVDVSLKEMVTNDQIEALTSGQIDAGLVRPPVARPKLESICLAAEPLLAAVPNGHRLVQESSLTLQELDDEPFIMYSPYEARYFHDLLTTCFAEAKVLPRYVQQLGQIHSILALVRAGLGLALVPEAASVLRFDGVVLKPLRTRPPRPVQLHLAWRRDHDNPILPSFLGIVRELAPG